MNTEPNEPTANVTDERIEAIMNEACQKSRLFRWVYRFLCWCTPMMKPTLFQCCRREILVNPHWPKKAPTNEVRDV